jgi:hypothetical protein
MCEPKSYAGKNCATCADATKKVHEQDCADCLTVEMETKTPYTKWSPKTKKETV